MKKLYLHMGFHKTATTSFQEICKKNNEKLLRQKIFYPIFNSSQINQKDISNHSIPMYSLFCGSPEKYHINIIYNIANVDKLNKDYMNSLNACLHFDNHVILSGEDISRLDDEHLLKFKLFLQQYDREIIPYIVVRSPYAFLCSSRQASINSGYHLTNTFFSSQISSIKKMKNVFPDIQFFAFSETCKHIQGPTAFLFDKMGINYTDFEFMTVNEGKSNVIVRIQNRLNKKERAIVNNKVNINFTSIAKFNNKTAFPQKYLLTKAEYAVIKEQCDAENAYFREHLGEEFCDKEIKFSEPDETVNLSVNLIDELEAKFERKLAECKNYFLNKQHNLKKNYEKELLLLRDKK